MSSDSGKPSFSQTCTLLSQYLKEKGTFGGLSLGMNRKGKLRPEVNTMNLFPVNENLVDVPRDVIKPMDLFPDLNNMKEDSCDKTYSSGVADQKQPGAAPMTIFYAGQVMVFNDLPAHKVKEIVMLANKSSPSGSSKHQMASFSNPSMAQSRMIPSGVVSHSQSPVRDMIHRPADPIARGDLPIARRASLHRFLEKRKDRITAKSPYVVVNSEATPPKPKPWLGFAAQETQ